MTYFLVASGASLTIGIGLGCLFVALRDAFKRDDETAPRPGADASRGSAPRAGR